MVPVESALRGFFKPVAKAVHARLRRTKCIPFVVDDNGTEVDGSCLDLPSRVVMASDTVREVVPPELLFNLMSKRYIREGVNVPSEVASELGIETIAVRDTHILFACLHCRLWYDFGSYVQYMFNSRNLESAILVFFDVLSERDATPLLRCQNIIASNKHFIKNTSSYTNDTRCIFIVSFVRHAHTRHYACQHTPSFARYLSSSRLSVLQQSNPTCLQVLAWTGLLVFLYSSTESAASSNASQHWTS